MEPRRRNRARTKGRAPLDSGVMKIHTFFVFGKLTHCESGGMPVCWNTRAFFISEPSLRIAVLPALPPFLGMLDAPSSTYPAIEKRLPCARTVRAYWEDERFQPVAFPVALPCETRRASDTQAAARAPHRPIWGRAQPRACARPFALNARCLVRNSCPAPSWQSRLIWTKDAPGPTLLFRSISERISDPMPSFVPVAFDTTPVLFTVQFGAAPLAGDVGSHVRTERWLDTQFTKAVACAALHATGSSSTYALEQRYGPDAFDGSGNKSDWAELRPRFWDRWHRGQSSIPRHVAKSDHAALDRIAAIRRVSSLVDEIMQLGFWRYVDPQPLTLLDLEPKTPLADRFARRPDFSLLPHRPSIRSFLARFREGLNRKESRYSAMDGLWLLLRSSYHLEDLLHYALCYLLWVEFAAVIRQDPVFASIASDLYQHTNRFFGRVQIYPHQQEPFDAAVHLLERAFMVPIRQHNPKIASVDAHLLHAFDVDRQQGS